eukprot:358271-Chlamydomonas_euryale.AAC.3
MHTHARIRFPTTLAHGHSRGGSAGWLVRQRAAARVPAPGRRRIWRGAAESEHLRPTCPEGLIIDSLYLSESKSHLARRHSLTGIESKPQSHSQRESDVHGADPSQRRLACCSIPALSPKRMGGELDALIVGKIEAHVLLQSNSHLARRHSLTGIESKLQSHSQRESDVHGADPSQAAGFFGLDTTAPACLLLYTCFEPQTNKRGAASMLWLLERLRPTSCCEADRGWDTAERPAGANARLPGKDALDLPPSTSCNNLPSTVGCTPPLLNCWIHASVPNCRMNASAPQLLDTRLGSQLSDERLRIV